MKIVNHLASWLYVIASPIELISLVRRILWYSFCNWFHRDINKFVYNYLFKFDKVYGVVSILWLYWYYSKMNIMDETKTLFVASFFNFFWRAVVLTLLVQCIYIGKDLLQNFSLISVSDNSPPIGIFTTSLISCSHLVYRPLQALFAIPWVSIRDNFAQSVFGSAYHVTLPSPFLPDWPKVRCILNGDNQPEWFDRF